VGRWYRLRLVELPRLNGKRVSRHGFTIFVSRRLARAFCFNLYVHRDKFKRRGCFLFIVQSQSPFYSNCIQAIPISNLRLMFYIFPHLFFKYDLFIFVLTRNWSNSLSQTAIFSQYVIKTYTQWKYALFCYIFYTYDINYNV